MPIFPIVLFLLITQIPSFSYTSSIELSPIEPQEVIAEILAPQEIIPQRKLSRYRKSARRLFSANFELDSLSFRLFTNELEDVRNSREKTEILFQTFRKNIHFEYTKPDSTVENRFIQSWVQAALAEKNDFIRYCYSHYFPDMLTYGSTMILNISGYKQRVGEEIRFAVNANPYYRRKPSKQRKKLYFSMSKNPKVLSSLTGNLEIGKLHFEKPFQATSFQTISNKEYVSNESRFKHTTTLNEPGIYRFTFYNENSFEEFFLVVSDIAPCIKYDKKYLYLFSDLNRNAAEKSNYLLLHKNTLAEGVIPMEGVAKVELKERSANDTIAMVIEQNGEYGFFKTVISDIADLHTDNHFVYLYSDRPLYAPRDTLYFGGVLRDFIDENWWRESSLNSITLQLSGEGFQSEKVITIDSSGFFHGSFQIPQIEGIGKQLTLSVANQEQMAYGLLGNREITSMVKPMVHRDIAIQTEQRCIGRTGLLTSITLHNNSMERHSGRLFAAFYDNNHQIICEQDTLLPSGGSVRLMTSFLHDTQWDHGSLHITAVFEDSSYIQKKVPFSLNNTVTAINQERTLRKNGHYLQGEIYRKTLSCSDSTKPLLVTLEGASLTHIGWGSGATNYDISFPLTKELGFNISQNICRKGRFTTTQIPIDIKNSLTTSLHIRSQQFNTDSYTAQIALTDLLENPISGNFSISVVDEESYRLSRNNDKGTQLHSLPQKREVSVQKSDNILSDKEQFSLLQRFQIYSLGHDNTSDIARLAGSMNSFYVNYRNLGSSCLCSDFHSSPSVLKILKIHRKIDIKEKAWKIPPSARYQIISSSEHQIYYNSSVSTDIQGKATISFSLPPSGTRWKMTFRGIDNEGRLIHHSEWIERELN